MAAWLGPTIKAVLPHIGTIVSAVQPIFTRKKAEAAANQMQLLQEQIAELQSAASQNAVHIKELATQMQSTVLALEEAATVAEDKIRRAFQLAIAAVSLAAIAVVLALVVILV